MTGARWRRFTGPEPRTPSTHELERAPELAALAVLDRAADVAIAALYAAHPYLGDHERPCWRPALPRVPEAEALLTRACQLQRALARYRDLFAVLRPDDLAALSVAPDNNDF